MITITRSKLRSLIREVLEADGGGGVEKFYFNSKGCDNSGNPDWEDENDGWQILDAASMDDAVSQLPPNVQKLIAKEIRKAGASSIVELIEMTAGWGLPFTLYGQADYDSIADNRL